MHLINECNAQHDTHANNSDKEREKTPGIVLSDLAYSYENVPGEQVAKRPQNIYCRR
jgi:hypothetical protein